jgi:hypothetical protein
MEKPGVIKMASKKRQALILCLVLGISIPAPAFEKRQEGGEAKMDLVAASQEIQNFEAVVNGVINSTFSTSPFAVVQKVKGAYLQGYGITFAFLINIHRAVVSTPFGQFRNYGNVTPEMKRRRIEELKEKLIQVLQDNGNIFRQLRKDEYVAIVAFFEDRNFPDEPSSNKTVVLSAQKKDLDEFSHKNDRLKEFKQRMKIIEY